MTPNRGATMSCQDCGAAMNFHAEKSRDPRTEEEGRRADPFAFQVIDQFFTCAGCGVTASRLEPPRGS